MAQPPRGQPILVQPGAVGERAPHLSPAGSRAFPLPDQGRLARAIRRTAGAEHCRGLRSGRRDQPVL